VCVVHLLLQIPIKLTLSQSEISTPVDVKPVYVSASHLVIVCLCLSLVNSKHSSC